MFNKKGIESTKTSAAKNQSRIRRLVPLVSLIMAIGASAYLGQKTYKQYNQKKIEQIYVESLGKFGDPLEIDTTIKEKVRKLTKDSSNQMEKVKAIWDAVRVSGILGIIYEGEYTDNRSAIRVFNEKKGDCSSISFLLSAMLTEAGIKSNVGYVEKDEDGDYVNAHVSVIISLGGKQIIIDPAAQKFDIKYTGFRRFNDRQVLSFFLTELANVELSRAEKEKMPYVQGFELLQRAIKLDPNNMLAHMNLALTYHKGYQYNKALKAYKQVVKINPNYGPVYYWLSILYGDLGKIRKSEWALEKARKLGFVKDAN